ncbi:MAG TPA: SRPBCC family protein [Streptosporangiales bacterium]
MSVDVRTELVIDAPRERVADYATDPANAPHWYANIRSVEWRTRPPLRVGSRFTFVARFLGRQLEYTYEVVAFEPGERLVMRTSEGPFPMETTYEWETCDDDRTRMTLRNRGEPSGFARLGAPVLANAMRQANRKDLARLAELLGAAGP